MHRVLRSSVIVGDVVAGGDARVIAASSLLVDESLLSAGESLPQHKVADAVLGEVTAVADWTTKVHMGSTVEAGNGRAVVTPLTPPKSESGAVLALVRKQKPRQRRRGCRRR